MFNPNDEATSIVRGAEDFFLYDPFNQMNHRKCNQLTVDWVTWSFY